MKLALEMILDFIAEKPSYTSESCTDLGRSQINETKLHKEGVVNGKPLKRKHG